jgi:hypothetical protein
VAERDLVELRDRLRDRPGFRLTYTDPDSDRQLTREFTVPPRPARVWFLALFSDELADMLLEPLEPDDAAFLWELIEDPDESMDETAAHRLGRKVLTRVADRPWWEASRLLSAYAQERHTFDGLAADRGMGDPLDWPVDRLCSWIEFRLLSGQHKDADRNALEARIKAPPMDEDIVRDEWDDEEAAADWMATAGAAPRA